MNDVPTELKRLIRDVPDFPVPGVLFRDITPLLAEPAVLRDAVRRMAEPFRSMGITDVLAVEARGFIFGVLVAQELQAGFVPVRKEGKLPFETIARAYELEYGRAVLEIHRDAFRSRRRPVALFVDDVLATGGTAAAAIDLAEHAGATVVGASFLIELVALGGRGRLGDRPVVSLVRF